MYGSGVLAPTFVFCFVGRKTKPTHFLSVDFYDDSSANFTPGGGLRVQQWVWLAD